MLRKMAAMRAAKDRKRLANPVERPPILKRFIPLQFAIRDKRNGDVSDWIDLRSMRDVARRLSVVRRFYASW